jgi:hypothetical protein
MSLLPVARYLQTAYIFIIKTEINLANKDKIIKLKRMDSRNLSICFRKGNSGEVTKPEDRYPEGIRCTKECDIWRGKEKRS